MQRAILQYNKPENAALVREALIKAKREDLINVLKAPYRSGQRSYRTPIVKNGREKNNHRDNKNKYNSRERFGGK